VSEATLAELLPEPWTEFFKEFSSLEGLTDNQLEIARTQLGLEVERREQFSADLDAEIQRREALA
jgi:hypothetical protein